MTKFKKGDIITNGKINYTVLNILENQIGQPVYEFKCPIKDGNFIWLTEQVDKEFRFIENECCELTPFEKELNSVIDNDVRRNIGLKYEAKCLLAIAEQEIRSKIAIEVEENAKHKEYDEGYAKGKNDAIKEIEENISYSKSVYERNISAINTLLNNLKDDIDSIGDRYGDDLPSMLDYLIWWTDNIIYLNKLEREHQEKTPQYDIDLYFFNTVCHFFDLKMELSKKDGNDAESNRYKRIIDWLKSKKEHILYKKVIVKPESSLEDENSNYEISEFENELEIDMNFYSDLRNDGKPHDELRKWIKAWKPRLLNVANKELYNEIVKSVEMYAYDKGYENGKLDTYNDLPKWRKSECSGFTSNRYRINGSKLYDQMSGLELNITELEDKLPKENDKI